MNIRGSSPEVEPRKRRRIELARRTCIIDAERIRIRPSPATLVPPLFGFLFGGLCFALLLADILVWPNFLPFALLAILLIFSLFSLPLSGMGLIYAAIGANVVIDQQKQSATWQQGLLGLGVGTTELVPFWKIEAIAVEETGSGEGRTTEEFAQWEIMLIKKSGRRLTIGRVSTARSLATPSLGRALEVAHAVAELTGAPLRLPGTTAKDQVGEPTEEAMRVLTRSEVLASAVSRRARPRKRR